MQLPGEKLELNCFVHIYHVFVCFLTSVRCIDLWAYTDLWLYVKLLTAYVSAAFSVYRWLMRILKTSGYFPSQLCLDHRRLSPVQEHLSVADRYINGYKCSLGTMLKKCLIPEWMILDLPGFSHIKRTLEHPDTNTGWFVGFFFVISWHLKMTFCKLQTVWIQSIWDELGLCF